MHQYLAYVQSKSLKPKWLSLSPAIIFYFVVCFQVMVMDYKLTYPSGTATAMLINSFHTNSGAELAG